MFVISLNSVHSTTNLLRPLANLHAAFSNNVCFHITLCLLNSPHFVCLVKNSRGISNALLISDDGNAHSTGHALDDQLGIVANLQAMLAFANDVMLSKEDRPRLISLEMMRQTVLVHRIGQSSLVCVCRKNRDPATYRDKIATAVLLLEKLFLLQVRLPPFFFGFSVPILIVFRGIMEDSGV